MTPAEAYQAGYQAGLKHPLTKNEANQVALILSAARTERAA